MSEPKKGRGRPRKNPIPEYNRVRQNISEDNDIPQTKNTDGDDDLKSFIGRKENRIKMNTEKSQDNFESEDKTLDEEILNDILEFEKEDGLNDIPDDNYNPLEDTVKERAYTSGVVGGANNQQQQQQQFQQQYGQPNNEKIIDEPRYNSNQANRPDVDSNIIGNNSGNGDIPNDNQNGNQQNTNNDKKVSNEDIAKTADVILLAYKNYAGVPFSYFATYDIKKLEALDKNNEIDLQTEVKRDGTTFKEYAEDFNKQVDKAFEISDQEVEALREPLIDVLKEQEFTLTPTQRLMLAVGQSLVGKTILCVKFLRQKKSDINEMKEIHAEKMEEIRRQNEIIRKQNELRDEEERQRQSNINKNNTNSKNEEPSNLRVVKENITEDEYGDDDNDNEQEQKPNINTNANTNETYAEFSEVENQNSTPMTPTLEDALNLNDDNIEDNDIPDA